MADLPFPLHKNGVIQDWHVVSKSHYSLMRLGFVDESVLVPEVVKLVNTAPLTKLLPINQVPSTEMIRVTFQ